MRRCETAAALRCSRYEQQRHTALHGQAGRRTPPPDRTLGPRTVATRHDRITRAARSQRRETREQCAAQRRAVRHACLSNARGAALIGAMPRRHWDRLCTFEAASENATTIKGVSIAHAPTHCVRRTLGLTYSAPTSLTALAGTTAPISERRCGKFGATGRTVSAPLCAHVAVCAAPKRRLWSGVTPPTLSRRRWHRAWAARNRASSTHGAALPMRPASQIVRAAIHDIDGHIQKVV